jgi:hypothetical protein
MIQPQFVSVAPATASLLIVLTAFVSNGCASNAVRQQAAYDRDIQGTKQALIALGDADSLAAAAMLSFGPTVHPVERLKLIERAVLEAPNRPDLVWLNIRLCSQIDGCNSEPLETQLRALNPDNGAAWVDSIGRAGKRNDEIEVRKNLAAIAGSRRLDTYWNTTIVHLTGAIVKTHTMEARSAFVASIGMASALALPAYQTIVNSCKGDQLKDPDMLRSCRQVSIVMRGGDTYITEMIGIAIAKQAWPEGSPEHGEAVSAKRTAHYRMQADGKLSLHRLLRSTYVEKHLLLMTAKTTEQDVVLAEIMNAKLNPNPPSDWTDKWSET